MEGERRKRSRGEIGYKYVASTVDGFVQQLAVCYMRDGYHHYVMGYVREGKDPEATDKRILEKYRIPMSKGQRYRLRELGHTSLHYLRHGRTFVIVARKPKEVDNDEAVDGHPFWREEAANIRRVKLCPIKYQGYSVSSRKDQFGKEHPSVRIAEDRFRELKAYFVGIAAKRREGDLVAELNDLPFARYAPVRDQLYEILRAVNKVRKGAGLKLLEHKFIKTSRPILRPFEEVESGGLVQGL